MKLRNDPQSATHVFINEGTVKRSLTKLDLNGPPSSIWAEKSESMSTLIAHEVLAAV